MKIVLKTITGKQHEVDVEATATVLDVKKLLEEEYEPASLRLCFNGAVLEDAKSLTEAGLKEGDSLVLAGRKRKIPKPAPQPPAEPPKAEAATATASVTPASSAQGVIDTSAKPSSMDDITVPSDTGAAPAASTETATAPAPTTANAAASEALSEPAPPTAFLSSAAPSAAAAAAAPPVPPAAPAQPENALGAPANLIDEICSMGFEDRSQIALALRAAYMNVERAVEYLFDGIPPHLVQELTRNAAPAAAPAASPAGGAPSAPTAAAPPSAEAALRTALATIPQFDQIRALYTQNTDTLPVVTQQIAMRHPAVYELIERNPEAFLAIMNESGAPGSASAASPSHSAAGVAPSTAHGVAPDGDEESIMNRMPAELELTADDRTAVQQLVELGGGMWDEQSALLVYLATQRDQEVAASILFEHGGVPQELLAEIAQQMAEEDADDYEDEQ